MDKENETIERDQPSQKKESLNQKPNYHGDKSVKVVLAVVLVLVILGGAGVIAKVAFGRHENRGKIEMQNVELGRGGMMRGERFGQARGEFGQASITGDITKIDGNNVTVKVSDTEYTVVINENTSLSKSGAIAKQSDLKVGDTIRVIGPSKSDGSLNANIIIIK